MVLFRVIFIYGPVSLMKSVLVSDLHYRLINEISAGQGIQLNLPGPLIGSGVKVCQSRRRQRNRTDTVAHRSRPQLICEVTHTVKGDGDPVATLKDFFCSLPNQCKERNTREPRDTKSFILRECHHCVQAEGIP